MPSCDELLPAGATLLNTAWVPFMALAVALLLWRRSSRMSPNTVLKERVNFQEPRAVISDGARTFIQRDR